MNEETRQPSDGITRSQFKKQAKKHRFGGTELNHFKDTVEPNLADQEMVGTRSERDTAEFKQKRLGRRLNIAIGILAGLLMIVLLIMRFVG